MILEVQIYLFQLLSGLINCRNQRCPGTTAGIVNRDIAFFFYDGRHIFFRYFCHQLTDMIGGKELTGRFVTQIQFHKNTA